MAHKRKKVAVIPAEKMALLAEKGLRAVRLSSAEMLALAENGLMELYAIKEGVKGPVPSLDRRLLEEVMATYGTVAGGEPAIPYVKDIAVTVKKNGVEAVAETGGWYCNSPAFALRGPHSGSVSLFKAMGKRYLHLEITKSSDHRASITIRLTDTSQRERLFSGATLFREGQCIESVHVGAHPVASFSSMVPGDYVLRVSDKKGEIASVNIGLEE